MEKLKVAGTWAGVIEIELDSWTVAMLRAEVAKRSGCPPDSINLICAGKVLRDGDGTATQTLAQLGVKNNAKILSSRVNVEQKQELLAEEERSRRLSRVKAAATALSQRHADGSLPVEDFNIEIEDQSGQKVNLGSETDQRAVMMGLMLHIKAKKLILKGMFKDALEVLVMGEEAFSLCNPKVIEMIDNVPILQIDMVWCYFMLRDISAISIAGVRLQKARQGLERAHGKDYSRVRLLQGGRQPEIALHLRLELLEAVVAYHSGQFDSSRDALTSARAKFLQLQVSDEALSFVMSMGFKERDARRALRMNNQDVGSAVDFLVEEKEKRRRIDEEDQKRRLEIRELKSYGVTPLKKAVNLERLNELVTLGFEKALAAEALRRNENDTQKALDDLTSPETNTMIQLAIETRKRKRQEKAENAVIEQLVSMGFERSKVVEVVQAGDTVETGMMKLIERGPTANPAAAASTSAPVVPNSENISANPSNGQTSTEEDMSNEQMVEEIDSVMEGELAHDIDQVDAYTDYDIDVTREGEAIQEYLALLASSTSSGGSSSSTADLPPQ